MLGRVLPDIGRRRRNAWCSALLVLLACGAAPLHAATGGPAAAAPSVAIYYDGLPSPAGEGYVCAHHIQNLLGHFNLRGEVIPVAAYRAGQLSRYRAAFFLGTRLDTRLAPAFLADVRNSRNPFCWIWRHIGSLVNSPEGRKRFGFSYTESRDDLEFNEVIYKGVALTKEEPDLDIVSITDPSSVQVLATAVTPDGTRRPYALRQDRFWYFADSVFSYMQEGGRFLAFCDLLHDILGIDHPPQSQALVRIEDVSADVDPLDLRQIADLLASRKIPFQFAVIPIFRSPPARGEIRISDRASLADAIHYMIERGGTPVMHGVTHQYEGQSGDDYEFWDAHGNRAIRADSAEAVLGRLETGLAECFANGIYPIAFETPHYAASETDYRTMRQVFTLFYERTMLLPDVETIQGPPYPLTDRFGRYVIPENLGYMPQDGPDPKVLIARARQLRVVRDAVASFYFHTFLDRSLLAEVLRGVSAAGYHFVSLRQFGGLVNYKGRYAVRTSSGTLSISPKDDYWRLRVFDAGGMLVREQVSAARLTGTVQVAAQVPSGGWAAVDCLREAPQQLSRWDRAKGTLRQWWSRLAPAAQRSLGVAQAVSPSGTAWVLWADKTDRAAANNQESYRSVLETFGYQTKLVRTKEFSSLPKEKTVILVIPEGAGARLREAQQQLILRHLSRGGRVVADGRQGWLTRLGLQFTGHRVPVTKVTDALYPEMKLEWQPPALVERFSAPANVRPLLTDSESSQTLALAFDYSNGRCLYLAAPFDPHTRDGTSRYPYFAQYLSAAFLLRPALHAPRLEVYFDPSYREGVGGDRLAAAWRQSGIRTVYIAAWQFYRRQTYDYPGLIRACHRNGISAYAWLVLPSVTPRMWEEHPEWRERTAAGTDGLVGWRQLMNLQNPACFQAAMDWMKEMLGAYAWDGVNLSELNFDADFIDYLRPERFVPMNNDVRADFRGKSGFDPALLFDPKSRYYHKSNQKALEQFLRYREDLVTEWHRRVLAELEPLRKSLGWEVIVTALDSLHSAYVRPALGVDSRRIAALMKEFNFTLQVEDPAEHWAKPPDRYRRLAEAYLKLGPDRRRLMFDVNVMSDRSVAGTSLPSATATGTELASTIASAAWASGRAAIYSEYTVPHQDWSLIGEALARASRAESDGGGWKVAGPGPVSFEPPDERSYYLDGRLWPAASPESILAPPGKHRLSADRPWYKFLDEGELRTRLLAMSGDLLDARVIPTGLTVEYSSPGRAVILLNQKPIETLLDGAGLDVPVNGAGDRWAVLAPGGRHILEISTTTRTGVVVGVWGWLSAFAVTAFGATTTFLMLAIYFNLRVQRKLRQRGQP